MTLTFAQIQQMIIEEIPAMLSESACMRAKSVKAEVSGVVDADAIEAKAELVYNPKTRATWAFT